MTITQSFSKLSAVAAGIAIAFALIAGVFATATPARAAALTSAQVNVPTGSANDVLAAGLNIVYFVAGILAVIVIIVAGFTLVTNTGEPEALKKARQAIIYAAIGLVVIFAAFAVTWFVLGRIG